MHCRRPLPPPRCLPTPASAISLRRPTWFRCRASRPNDGKLQTDIIKASTSAENIGQALVAPMPIIQQFVAEVASNA